MKKLLLWTLLGGLAASSALHAELTKAQRKEAQSMLSGTLYTRIDIPCGTGRQPFGTYMYPLVEVSPDGVNTDSDQETSFGWYHAQSTFWGIAPNDTLRFDEADWDEDTVELEFEGVGRTDGNDTVIKFVGIRSVEDFRKAFDRAFARVPLQDEQTDWSPEVKKAIADRKLLKGMNKRQVFYVTGSPESSKESEENGKKIEIWTLRQSKGLKMGFWGFSSEGPASGVPKTLRFVDNSLEDFDAAGAGGGVKLDE